MMVATLTGKVFQEKFPLFLAFLNDFQLLCKI